MPVVMPNPVVIATLAVQTPFRVSTSRLYYVPSGSIDTLAALQTVANNIHDWFKDGPLTDVLAEAASMLPTTVRYISGQTDWEQTAVGGSTPGTDGSELMPDECVIEIQKRTGYLGRANRGRIFITGSSENFNDNGRITDPGQLLIVALANKLQATLDSIVDLVPHHYNRKLNTLVQIIQHRGMKVYASRRDRRAPLNLTPI